VGFFFLATLSGAPGLNYSEFVFFAIGVIGANMGCELLVALQLEVAHHLVERCTGGWTRRVEPPATFRATETPKPLSFNPYQLPVHGFQCRCALTLFDRMP
jgi:hypothetical protein